MYQLREFENLPEQAKKEMLYQDYAKIVPKEFPFLEEITSLRSDSVAGTPIEMTAETINRLIQPESG